MGTPNTDFIDAWLNDAAQGHVQSFKNLRKCDHFRMMEHDQTFVHHR